MYVSNQKYMHNTYIMFERMHLYIVCCWFSCQYYYVLLHEHNCYVFLWFRYCDSSRHHLTEQLMHTCMSYMLICCCFMQVLLQQEVCARSMRKAHVKANSNDHPEWIIRASYWKFHPQISWQTHDMCTSMKYEELPSWKTHTTVSTQPSSSH